MCRDQGLLGVPFKGWNRLIRPLALQDLNKVPVVVGFHYYTFFNWAINGKVVQLFFEKVTKPVIVTFETKRVGGYCFRFYPSTLNIILRSQSKGQASLFYWKSYYRVSNALSRWRFMWSSQSFSSYFVPFDVKSYFHKRPKLLSYKYIYNTQG